MLLGPETQHLKLRSMTRIELSTLAGRVGGGPNNRGNSPHTGCVGPSRARHIHWI